MDHSFFSFSSQFYRYRNFIYAIYGLAIGDIVTTIINLNLGFEEINLIGRLLFAEPLLFILWRIAFLTIILIFPYWISGKTMESRATEYITICFWWVLVFLSVFPVIYNLILGANQLNLMTIAAIRTARIPIYV